MTNKDLYKYSGTVIRVVDGDTIIGMIDLGMKVFKQVVIRLANINAPELTSKDIVIKEKANASKNYLSAVLTNQVIYFNSKSLDKYDRSIAEVFLEGSPVSINKIMVDKGYAAQQKY